MDINNAHTKDNLKETRRV